LASVSEAATSRLGLGLGSEGLVHISGLTTESVMHGQCNARPTVTFPAEERHQLLAGTELHCLVNIGTCVNTLPKFVSWQCTGWE